MADFADVKKALIETGTLNGIAVEEALKAIVLQVAPEKKEDKPVDQTPEPTPAPEATEIVETHDPIVTPA